MTTNLDKLAARIDTEYKSIKANAQDTLTRARTIGEMLTKAKESLAHGEYIPWVVDNCPFNRDQAKKYTYIHKHWDVLTRGIKRKEHFHYQTLDHEAITIDEACDFIRKLLTLPSYKRIDEGLEELPDKVVQHTTNAIKRTATIKTDTPLNWANGESNTHLPKGGATPTTEDDGEHGSHIWGVDQTADMDEALKTLQAEAAEREVKIAGMDQAMETLQEAIPQPAPAPTPQRTAPTPKPDKPLPTKKQILTWLAKQSVETLRDIYENYNC